MTDTTRAPGEDSGESALGSWEKTKNTKHTKKRRGHEEYILSQSPMQSLKHGQVLQPYAFVYLAGLLFVSFVFIYYS